MATRISLSMIVNSAALIKIGASIIKSNNFSSKQGICSCFFNLGTYFINLAQILSNKSISIDLSSFASIILDFQGLYPKSAQINQKWHQISKIPFFQLSWGYTPIKPRKCGIFGPYSLILGHFRRILVKIEHLEDFIAFWYFHQISLFLAQFKKNTAAYSLGPIFQHQALISINFKQKQAAIGKLVSYWSFLIFSGTGGRSSTYLHKKQPTHWY